MFDSVGLGVRRLKTCISIMVPGDAQAASVGTTV